MTLNKITALLQPPESNGRVDIYVDGAYFMSVSEDAAVAAGLAVGKEMDEAAVAALEQSAQVARALHKAYDRLSYGDMSEQKMFDKLTHHGFSQEIAAAAVAKLVQSGYLDDGRYAAALAQNLSDTRLYGPRRIAQELYRRGIDRETAENAVAQIEADYTDSVKRLATGRLKRDLTDPKEVKKLIAALLRCGHEYETVKAALYELTEATEEWDG